MGKLLVALAVGALSLTVGLGKVEAQGGIDLFSEEACQENPHSEACICVNVMRYALYPIGFDLSGKPHPDPASSPPAYPVFNEETGLWVGIPPTFNETTKVWEGGNLRFSYSDRYGQHCTLSYVREDLRRLWYFVAAVAGLIAAMSFAWAGVMYMQESASGGDMSRSRGVVVRVAIGLVLVGSAFGIWESTSGLLVGHLQNWTLDFNTFYEWN